MDIINGQVRLSKAEHYALMQISPAKCTKCDFIASCLIQKDDRGAYVNISDLKTNNMEDHLIGNAHNIGKINANKLIIQTTFDDMCFSEYYSGHGHAFESEDLIACIQFSPSVDYSETVKEIIDLIMEDIRSYEFYILNEDYKEQINEITDQQIEQSIRDQLIGDIKDSDSFYNDSLKNGLSEEIKDDIFYELPCQFGYIHIYKQ